jgi:signal transduction histidine kinase
LEDELRVTREELQSTIEQLEGTNEELKASIEGVIVTLVDVNDLKEVQSKLECTVVEVAVAKDRLETVLASITDAYLVLDSDWRFVQVNPVAEKEAFARPASELLGKVIWDVFPQTRGGEVYEQYHAAVASGRPVHLEAKSRILDKWGEIHAYPRAGRLEVYLREITARKEAEARLGYLASFPERNPNPVVEADLEGNVRYANPAALRLFPDLDGQGPAHPWLANWAEEALRASEAALRDLNAHLESMVAERTAQLQQRTRQLQRLTLEISETEDRERKRMAEILHDDLQQQLAATKFQLSLLTTRAQHDPSIQAVVAQIDRMLKEAIEKSRSLSHELSPTVMHHANFSETCRWLASQVQAKHGLVCHVQAQGEVRSESDALKGFLYKAAQEFLFNVVKHARVNDARLRVRRFGRYLCLSVSDRGRGFDPQGIQEAAGFGLLSIRERVELLGGSVFIMASCVRTSDTVRRSMSC